jgi:hypothetical protein
MNVITQPISPRIFRLDSQKLYPYRIALSTFG